uniref:OO_Ba0013J05-OO_Ba0033A15.15 protein n=1 Tax=Oryza officinalis TaxID=4535 RepID=D0ABF8_9ORYZ|nr:OO_Ba0013J05-OO_Ba0033A15.15 [Oryza officinalis]
MALQNGINLPLVPRITIAAQSQLEQLLMLLQNTQLSQSQDSIESNLKSKNGLISGSALYNKAMEHFHAWPPWENTSGEVLLPLELNSLNG